MDFKERINRAAKQFNIYYGDDQDEWTETFYWGQMFAIRLLDCEDSDLVEKVVQWLEKAAATPPE